MLCARLEGMFFNRNVIVGRITEKFSAVILFAKGYSIIAWNRQISGVEIDILARKKGLWIVTEVKSRSTKIAGHHAVLKKQELRLKKAANTLTEKTKKPTRIDLIVWFPRWPFVQHIQNVFEK